MRKFRGQEVTGSDFRRKRKLEAISGVRSLPKHDSPWPVTRTIYFRLRTLLPSLNLVNPPERAALNPPKIFFLASVVMFVPVEQRGLSPHSDLFSARRKCLNCH